MAVVPAMQDGDARHPYSGQCLRGTQGGGGLVPRFNEPPRITVVGPFFFFGRRDAQPGVPREAQGSKDGTAEREPDFVIVAFRRQDQPRPSCGSDLMFCRWFLPGNVVLAEAGAPRTVVVAEGRHTDPNGCCARLRRLRSITASRSIDMAAPLDGRAGAR